MKRMWLALLAAVAVLCAQDDGLDAGSKWKPWKGATCAAPMGCSGCYAPAGCSGPGCFGPSGFAPNCDGCFAPGCGGGFAPNCGGCFAPGCGAPFFTAPSFDGGGWAYGQPLSLNGSVAPAVGGPPVIGSYSANGPMIGGMSMTPAYYAPVAPMTFSVPAIPAAEDLTW